MRMKMILCCLLWVLAAAGCGKKNVQPDVALADIADAVRNAYGDAYIPSMAVDETMLEQQYGLKKDMYQEALGEVSMISAQVDTFIAVHAVPGQADAVEAALTAYQDYLINDTLNYPMNIGKVNGSQIYLSGDYVFFIMLGDMPDDAADLDEETAKAYAEEQNKIAVDAIDSVLKSSAAD